MLYKAERAEWGRYLKPKHPKIIKMDDEISRQERLLDIFRQQGRDQLISARDSLRIQVRGLEDQVKEWETKASEASRKINEYEQLKANEERLKSAYEKLLNWLQTVGLTKNLDPENVSVMERASTAQPVKSSLVKRLGVAGFLGLALGLAILWFVDRHDDRITSVAELMEQFDAPVMGHVPSLETGKSQLIELVHSADERHAFVESFRDIRSALLFSNPDGSHPQVLMITSSVPNEGKSAVSANLAVTLALSGSRVLLVDADMRCATVHRYFGVGAEPGLSEILTEQVHYSEAIKQTATPNLSLISSGRAVTNAGELFLHPNTTKLVGELRGQFDIILFDSPPVLATADTPSLAPKTDGVLFVVRAGFTSARLVRNSLALLGQRRVSVLGMILNRADAANPGYHQYKYAKYYKTPKIAARA
jgi:capsular exopolysaccharide synthesis family protein